MITLPIKRFWFDMIASGEKKEEYRSLTKRYSTMFHNAMNENGCFWCRLRNGYRTSSPTLTVYVRLSVGVGNPDWGAVPGEKYFVLSVLKIE